MGKFNSIDDLREHIEKSDDTENVEEVSTETPTEEPKVEEPKVEEPKVEEPKVEENPAEEPEVEETPAEEPEVEETSEETPDDTQEQVDKIIYKSMGEEHEVPDYLAAAAKTSEQKEELKRLHERAAGLDHMEKKNSRLTEQMEELKPVVAEGKELKTEIGFYNKLLDQKKHHELFRQINISDDDVLQVASKILQYKELTPEQKSAYDNSMHSAQRMHQLELQTQQLQEQVNNSTVSSHENQLNQVLERPDVKQAMSAYDSRLGNSGAFKNEVINRAAMVEMQSQGKQILTPEEAVNQVLKVIGHVTESQSQQAGSEGEVAKSSAPQTQVAAPTPKPTIPNVQGGSKSPAKKVFKSIAELRKHADSLDEY